MSFPPIVPQIVGPLNLNAVGDQEGLDAMATIGGAGAAAVCPSADEKREFYTGTYDYSNRGRVAACTNGSQLLGVFRDNNGADQGTFRIDGTFPGPAPRWTGSFASAANPGNRLNFEGVYQGGGIATPLARGPAQEPPPIPGGDPVLSISRSGLVFVAQGGALQRQFFDIVNTGGETLDWTVSASTLSGGDWLTAAPASGSTSAAREASAIEVTVDPTGLAPGDYFGRVTVRSESTNETRTVTIAARVLDQNAFLPVTADPGGFLFVHTQPGGAAPRTLTLTNPGSQPIQIAVESFFEAGVAEWFRFEAPQQNELAGGASLAIEIEVTADFTPGVFSGELRVTSQPSAGGEAAQTLRLDGRLIVPPAAAGLAKQQGGCAPTQLVPLLRAPSLGFSAVAGFPLSIEADVFDDCGEPLTSGSVTAEFSNGDPQLGLEPLRDGRWVSTWAPFREADTANISLRAEVPPDLAGTLEVAGAVPDTAQVPALAAPPLSAISFARDRPLSLGGYTAMFGAQLAGALTVADRLPLPETLEQTTVLIGGRPMPLLFASGGQVNGIVPFDLPVGPHSVLIERAAALSAPLRVMVAPAQPALFSKDSSGAGQGLIERVSPDGSRSLAEPGTPARPGDVLVIYASGLGRVSGDVNVAEASPASPLAETLEPVSVRLGEVDAAVSFAGLTPGFAGLYQLNVPVPAGAPAGDAVPVVATVEEASSPPVTIAISAQ